MVSHHGISWHRVKCSVVALFSVGARLTKWHRRFDVSKKSAVRRILTSGNSAVRQFGSGGAAVSTLYKLHTGLSNQFTKIFSPYLQRLTEEVKTRGVSFAKATTPRLVHPFVSHRGHALLYHVLTVCSNRTVEKRSETLDECCPDRHESEKTLTQRHHVCRSAMAGGGIACSASGGCAADGAGMLRLFLRSREHEPTTRLCP